MITPQTTHFVVGVNFFLDLSSNLNEAKISYAIHPRTLYRLPRSVPWQNSNLGMEDVRYMTHPGRRKVWDQALRIRDKPKDMLSVAMKMRL